MAIYLDDEAVQIQADNLGLAIVAAQERLAAIGRVVVEVRLDDEPLTGDALESESGRPIEGCELHLYSADPKRLAADTFEQVRDQLADARSLQDEAADLLQRDDAVSALKTLGRVVEVWLQTQQAVLHGATLVGIDLDTVSVDGEPMAALTDGLLEQLQTLKELIVANDTVALADVMAYEWPSMLDSWDALLAELIQRCQTP